MREVKVTQSNEENASRGFVIKSRVGWSDLQGFDPRTALLFSGLCHPRDTLGHTWPAVAPGNAQRGLFLSPPTWGPALRSPACASLGPGRHFPVGGRGLSPALTCSGYELCSCLLWGVWQPGWRSL